MPADYTPAPEAEIRELLELEEKATPWNAEFVVASRNSIRSMALELLDRRKAMEEAPHEAECESEYCKVCHGRKDEHEAEGEEFQPGECDCWKSKFPKERSNG